MTDVSTLHSAVAEFILKIKESYWVVSFDTDAKEIERLTKLIRNLSKRGQKLSRVATLERV